MSVTLTLGLRLTLRSGREALVRLAVTAAAVAAAAVAAGVALLLGVLAEFHAFQASAGQPCWSCTTGTSVLAPLPSHGELWNNSADLYQGQTITRLDVAALGQDARKPPGFWRLTTLVLGVGLYVYGLSKATRDSIGAPAYPGLLVTMAGLVIAGPWVTSAISRLFGRLSGGSAAVALTLIVAGCSLAVAAGGGLVDRKRPFTLLRVSGDASAAAPHDKPRQRPLRIVVPGR